MGTSAPSSKSTATKADPVGGWDGRDLVPSPPRSGGTAKVARSLTLTKECVPSGRPGSRHPTYPMERPMKTGAGVASARSYEGCYGNPGAARPRLGLQPR
ncbi:hypothetical protein MEX01_51250 [Methylorubrum extorquens]|nr:hypothetical protein MEX01_51250 [Methylorubrum extorquens]